MSWFQTTCITYFSTYICLQSENAFVIQTVIFLSLRCWFLLYMNNLAFHMIWFPMYIDYGETMHHYGPRQYSTPCNVHGFHFKLEFWLDIPVCPWEMTESTGVWNHNCEGQALDVSWFAKSMTVAPWGLWVTVVGFIPQKQHLAPYIVEGLHTEVVCAWPLNFNGFMIVMMITRQ